MTASSPVTLESPSQAPVSPVAATSPGIALSLRAFLRPGFNLQMIYAAIVIVTFSAIGCRLTQVSVPNAANMVLALTIAVALLLPLAIFLRERNNQYFADLLSVIFWAVFLAYMFNFPAEIGARLGARFPLRDGQLAQFDRAVHLPIPTITAWASQHWLGRTASATYFWLFPFMRLAILLPPLAGRAQSAKKFLTANLLMFLLGIPLFVLLPAVGPWFGYHTLPRPDQLASQGTLLFLRKPAPCEFRMPTGIICFPSFHVVWAILCVYALWSFKFLRVPASVLAALIILSTVTTGEHYLLDLAAGAFIAIASISCTEKLTGLSDGASIHR
jgi:hypothetical protein